MNVNVKNIIKIKIQKKYSTSLTIIFDIQEKSCNIRIITKVPVKAYVNSSYDDETIVMWAPSSD